VYNVAQQAGDANVHGTPPCHVSHEQEHAFSKYVLQNTVNKTFRRVSLTPLVMF